MAVLVACALGVAIGLLLVWANARSTITIAVVEITDGVVRVARGALAPRVLADLRDVASKPPIKAATVRILRAKDHARLEVHGTLSDHQLQRMRNVVGNVSLAQLGRAKRR